MTTSLGMITESPYGFFISRNVCPVVKILASLQFLFSKSLLFKSNNVPQPVLIYPP